MIEGEAEVEVDPGAVRSERQGRRVVPDRIIVARWPRLIAGDGQRLMDPEIGRMCPLGPLEQAHGFGKLAGPYETGREASLRSRGQSLGFAVAGQAPPGRP